MDYLITLWNGKHAYLARGAGLSQNSDLAYAEVFSNLHVFFSRGLYQGKKCTITLIPLDCEHQYRKEVEL